MYTVVYHRILNDSLKHSHISPTNSFRQCVVAATYFISMALTRKAKPGIIVTYTFTLIAKNGNQGRSISIEKLIISMKTDHELLFIVYIKARYFNVKV